MCAQSVIRISVTNTFWRHIYETYMDPREREITCAISKLLAFDVLRGRSPLKLANNSDGLEMWR